MQVKRSSPTLKKKKPLFSNFLTRSKATCSKVYSHLLLFFSSLEAKLINLNIISQTNSQNPASTNFRTSYFSRNEQKFIYSNFFIGGLQAIIDLIRLFSGSGESDMLLLILILNIVLTLISCLMQYKFSNKILIFIMANFTRVIIDISLRFPKAVDDIHIVSANDHVSMFYLNQNIIMLLLVNSYVITNIYLKKLSWLFIQFLIFVIVAMNFQFESFHILSIFIYTYKHLMLANILVNFEIGVYEEVYEFKAETLQEKFEMEEILNIISNGILIIDFELSQVLFANKKLLEMFELESNMSNLKKLNLKDLLEIFNRQISKITEKIYYGKNTNNNFICSPKTNKKIKTGNSKLDSILVPQPGKAYYMNTYSKFQDLFINLKGNFDYMQKRNLSQNLSALRIKKHLQLILKPTIYKQRKSFFLIFNQEFEYENELNNSKVQEKQKGLYPDSKLTLNFLMNLFYRLKIPLSLIINNINLIKNEKIDSAKQVFNTIICALNYQNVFMNNLLDIFVFESKKIMVYSKKINFRGLFDELIKEFSLLAEMKEISIVSIIDEMLPSEFNCDELKLKQIFYLLIDNALKFSNNGGTIKLVATKKTQIKKVKFAIHDTGIGISIEGLTKLKKTLVKPDLKHFLEKSDKIKMGICLCQNYLLMLNKSEPFGLKVKSKVNESSIFSFYLDLEDEKSFKAISNSKNDISIKNEISKKSLNSLISRNDSGLVININKKVKISEYHIEKELHTRIKKMTENQPTKINIISENDDYNYDSELENSEHRVIDINKYKFAGVVGTKPLLNLEKIPNVSINLLERVEDDLSSPIEEFEKVMWEDILIINRNYFHLLTFENLLTFNKLTFIKYFDIHNALKLLGARILKSNEYSDMFKVILMELEMTLEDNLANLKSFKKGLILRKIPYIPIIGYSSLENKEMGDILIEKGLSDIIYLPINEDDFLVRISPWITR